MLSVVEASAVDAKSGNVAGRIWFDCVAAEDTLKDCGCCRNAVLAVDRENDGTTKADTFSGKTAVNQTNWRSFIIYYCLDTDYKCSMIKEVSLRRHTLITTNVLIR